MYGGFPVVFIVDDDPAFCEVLREGFGSVGLTARAFGLASDFLDAVADDPPGCVVLDVRLPGIDGVATQKRLLARQITLPVIFVSGYADVWTVVQVMKLGAFDFLEKPFSFHDLLGRVRAAIQRNARDRERVERIRKIQALLQTLSNREIDVLDRIGWGMSNKCIANDLGLSVRTVEFHRSNVNRKLGSSQSEAQAFLIARAFCDVQPLQQQELEDT